MLAAVIPLVVALGGSVTAGYGLPSPSTQNYAAVYTRSIGGKLVNFAEPGAQCDGITQNQVPNIPSRAAVVILDCGVNDIGGFGYTPEGKPDGRLRTPAANDAELAAAQIAFTKTIAAIRTRVPKATIVVVNLRHWQRMTGAESPQFAKDVDAWNAMLARSRLHVVDINNDARMYAPGYIFPDVLHPNVEGNAAIASDFPTAWTQNASPLH